MCFNGNTNCHHQPAPRGSKTGTQGKKGNLERSIIPQELCKHIVDICEEEIMSIEQEKVMDMIEKYKALEKGIIERYEFAKTATYVPPAPPTEDGARFYTVELPETIFIKDLQSLLEEEQ
jgi:hypothetical protein